MNDRTTAEVIDALGSDIDRCHQELISSIDTGEVDSSGNVSADYEYHARQLIRAIMAFIEAVTFSMKVKAANHCIRLKRDISPAEGYLAVDMEHVLSEKGEVVERPAHIRLADNIRFAFALQQKAHAIECTFDPSTEWWSCLKKSIRVRDRLTHPKLPGDVDVSGEEIVTALKAYHGFSEQAMSYPDFLKGGKRRRSGQSASVKRQIRKRL